jgi:hypothetical protein
MVFPSRIKWRSQKWPSTGTPLPLPRARCRTRTTTRSPTSMNSSGVWVRSSKASLQFVMKRRKPSLPSNFPRRQEGEPEWRHQDQRLRGSLRNPHDRRRRKPAARSLRSPPPSPTQYLSDGCCFSSKAATPTARRLIPSRSSPVVLGRARRRRRTAPGSRSRTAASRRPCTAPWWSASVRTSQRPSWTGCPRHRGNRRSR